MPQISVVVPVYKVEPYLRRCVDSILGQTFADFELILVDDGSPDNCPAICDEYAAKDSRVHVIHQENGGLSAARNAGIDWAFANSNSQWLSFVDSDDWVHPEYLERLLEAAVTTGCSLSVCGLLRTQGEALPEIPIAAQAERLTANEFYCMRAGEHVSPAAACAKLYSKKLFVDLRFPVGKLHEDEFTTYLTVYHAGEIAFCSVLLYAYYINPEGIMHSKWTPKKLHVIEAYEKQLAFSEITGNEILYKRVLHLMVLNLTLQCIGLEEIKDAESINYSHYHNFLQNKLRSVLKLAKPYQLFPMSLESNQWIYYQAYPKRMIWRNRVRTLLPLKGLGKE